MPLILHRQNGHAVSVDQQKVQALAVDGAKGKVACFFRSGGKLGRQNLTQAGLGHDAMAAGDILGNLLQNAENPVFRLVEKGARLEIHFGDELHLRRRLTQAAGWIRLCRWRFFGRGAF